MIKFDSPYSRQVRLLVSVLPMVGREACFALKGGTAINLFVRDMPRLSVDIDLAFLPTGDRAAALQEIDAALRRISDGLTGRPYGYRVRAGKRQESLAYGLLVADGAAEIKIEVSPVSRGTVYPESMRRIVGSAEAEFGFAEVPVVSFADLYAGKIVAALDRQHPRDLFDVKLLLAKEGIDDALFRAFLVYLISHDGSIARVLNPTLKPLADLFERQFVGMTSEPVTLEELEQARAELIAALHGRLGERERDFLVSFKRREPKWELLGVAHAPELPAIRWKLQNLAQMTPDKHRGAIGNLERVLDAL
ncbi:nucleotidyl transferase AbiEii/AbiGii toxin family protein [Sulfuritalea hydrogenivorans]|uniref:Nucleotidyl transferase AbiEii/AbiGii toxin family protein n=1 Tax=Sulfuritalea hydrogenivorans sk43H TaxID=1223802 RepID=W0SAS2_9PROT|nr:nucleotidyl transferase AbiEii/AbiGii toxin family protein [Sulfuritalea hydrogenivorans]BAO27830.1 hypothetical protein SUTH_00010 [Sulfuritalea hydrogenivorans sk43H]